MKRKEGVSAGGADGAADGGSAKKTPASRGKKRKIAASADDDDDDDDMEPTPCKKPARGKKVAASAPVNEEEEITLKPIKNEQYAFVYPAVSTLLI